jgi:diaminohydroxyphosphoribosylaminopyrimidine deaminase/5-amino-6-(5-phosphoribosylamino)uracil reductase
MQTVFSPADQACMAEALRLAAEGLYTTEPNPRVGCVIVKDGSVVGRGFHKQAGAAHAEVLALKEAGAAAQGATVYVSMEPCCHQGRTGPCTEALIKAGVERVVAAMTDPNPKVAGQGFARLQAAGMPTAVGLMEAQARALNPGFISRMSRGRPWVRCKIAASMDGGTALADGASKWISGEAAREDSHRWRARSSLVLTGIGTVLKDDPALTVRLPGEWRQPLRMVVDSRLKTPPAAGLFKQPGDTYIATLVADTAGHAPLLKAGAKIWVLPEKGGHVDLAALFTRLTELECNEVLVEAGAALNGALLDAGLLDELLVYLAPHLLGDGARGMFSIPALTDMQQRREFAITDARMVGNDIRLLLRPK